MQELKFLEFYILMRTLDNIKVNLWFSDVHQMWRLHSCMFLTVYIIGPYGAPFKLHPEGWIARPRVAGLWNDSDVGGRELLRFE